VDGGEGIHYSNGIELIRRRRSHVAIRASWPWAVKAGLVILTLTGVGWLFMAWRDRRREPSISPTATIVANPRKACTDIAPGSSYDNIAEPHHPRNPK
jgi:hypothetical protein